MIKVEALNLNDDELVEKAGHAACRLMTDAPPHIRHKLMNVLITGFIGGFVGGMMEDYEDHMEHDPDGCTYADPLGRAEGLLDAVKKDICESIVANAKKEGYDIPGLTKYDTNFATFMEIMAEAGRNRE